MRALVLSDTHIPHRARALPREVYDALAELRADAGDVILHAGDLTSVELLVELEAVAPVHAVRGNMDRLDPRLRLPERLVVDFGPCRIGLTHGHLGRGRSTPERALSSFPRGGVDAVIFGHSHAPLLARQDGLLLLNPGSPTDRRRQPRGSFAWLELGPDGLLARHVYVAAPAARAGGTARTAARTGEPAAAGTAQRTAPRTGDRSHRRPPGRPGPRRR